ncbi:hypothetical protein FA13DRAFT_1774756 [Coprinellus micaceus]|uniref:Uncharacterized protein n=1 Tax=Coprinellus micaceus TaxID=71717 RepID=A0A4Y7T8Y0_COPMI|nr:hypothetical protein FA13DRAFT_1774756 [Coprinellus micaceus]
MARKSLIRSRSPSSSGSVGTQSHSYDLRSLTSLPLLKFTPTPSTHSFPSSSGGQSVSETPRQASVGSEWNGNRSSQKRGRSLSRMVLPTIYPATPKKRKIVKTRPLVTFNSPNPGSQGSEPSTLLPSPTSSQSTELPEIVVGRTFIPATRTRTGTNDPARAKKAPGIKMPVSKALRVRGSSQRQSVPRCGPSRPCHGSQRDSNGWHDSDVEIVAITRKVPPPRPIQRQPSLTLKIPARNPIPRAPQSEKRDQGIQTDGSATQLHSGEGGAWIAPGEERSGFNHLEMKYSSHRPPISVLEERMNSWGQYNNAEEEMSIIVQNYLALERELADTQEKLRSAKSQKKRHWSTALPTTEAPEQS